MFAREADNAPEQWLDKISAIPSVLDEPLKELNTKLKAVRQTAEIEKHCGTMKKRKDGEKTSKRW